MSIACLCLYIFVSSGYMAWSSVSFMLFSLSAIMSGLFGVNCLSCVLKVSKFCGSERMLPW
jgi:hypothetical protein